MSADVYQPASAEAVELIRRVREATEQTPYRMNMTTDGFEIALDLSDTTWHGLLYSQRVDRVFSHRVQVIEHARKLKISDVVTTVTWSEGAHGPIPRLGVSKASASGRVWTFTSGSTSRDGQGNPATFTFSSEEGRRLITEPAKHLGWRVAWSTNAIIGLVVACIALGGLLVAGVVVAALALAGSVQLPDPAGIEGSPKLLIIGICFAFIGAVTGYFVVGLARQERKLRNGITVSGEIVDIVEERRRYRGLSGPLSSTQIRVYRYPVLRYRTLDGREFTMKSQYADTGGRTVGDRVDVVYAPDEPTLVRVAKSSFTKWAIPFAGGIAALLLAIGVTFILISV
ncbi:MAG TPA: DUF3592 domain-containing protein [Actinopolymorphaceae bacterium]|jgi:hypothetical protein